MSCHELRIEEGRPLQERMCQLCNRAVEDERHFVVSCPRLETVENPSMIK